MIAIEFYKLAKMIRSKNAGPFEVSLDILFENYETYAQVIEANVLTEDLISRVYQVPLEKVQLHLLPLAYAIKFSFPRKYPSGDFHDTDVYGCQLHAPLVTMEIPISG